MARALISGITGQDGSYLAELLLEKGYEVHGLVRRVATEDSAQRLSRLAAIRDRIQLHPVSLESFASLYTVVTQVQPDELYHLAAQTFVSTSFEDAFSTFRANIDGTHFVLESVRQQAPRCKVYFAASSEVFGNPPESPQTERTPMVPCSPYGITKLTGLNLARYYRDAYGVFVSLRDSVQPRVAAPRHGIRHPQGDIASGPDQARAGSRAEAGKSRSPARLGLCPGLCAGHPCHAPAGAARRFRRGDWRNPFGARAVRTGIRPRRLGLPRICRLARNCFGRSKFAFSRATPAKRGQNLAGNPNTISGGSSKP